MSCCSHLLLSDRGWSFLCLLYSPSPWDGGDLGNPCDESVEAKSSRLHGHERRVVQVRLLLCESALRK
eukprot:1507509-Amphidinium_carterae.1